MFAGPKILEVSSPRYDAHGVEAEDEVEASIELDDRVTSNQTQRQSSIPEGVFRGADHVSQCWWAGLPSNPPSGG